MTPSQQIELKRRLNAFQIEQNKWYEEQIKRFKLDKVADVHWNKYVVKQKKNLRKYMDRAFRAVRQQFVNEIVRPELYKHSEVLHK